MHILIVTTGGITRVYPEPAEVLLAKALVRRGQQFRALTYYEAKSDVLNTRRETIDDIEVERIEPAGGGLPCAILECLAGDRIPDVIHIHHLRNQFAFQAALLRNPRKHSLCRHAARSAPRPISHRAVTDRSTPSPCTQCHLVASGDREPGGREMNASNGMLRIISCTFPFTMPPG